MFDIEFNLGLILATLLTGVLLTALITQQTPQRPMQPPEDVNLSDTETDESEDEVDGKKT